MTLPQRKVTARVTDRSCQPVIRAADNQSVIARPRREGQVPHGLDRKLM
jgi:hypothetical protein